MDEKAGRVAEVFSKVAANYDVMNDVMSGGDPKPQIPTPEP